MSTQIQYRRGSAAQNDAFTGALAEITVDTTNWTLRVHDGSTAGGGGNLATVDYVSSAIGAISTSSIQNGTSNVNIGSSGSNVTVGVGGTADILVATTSNVIVKGDILPAANVTYNLGAADKRFGDLYLSNSTIYLGGAQLSANATAVTITNPGGGSFVMAGSSTDVQAATVSATGTITGGNVSTGGFISAAGNITGNYLFGNGSQLTGIDATSIQSGTSNFSVIASGGNIRGNIAGSTVTNIYADGLAVTGLISATGNITGGNLSGTSIVGTLTTAAQTNITSVGTLDSLSVTGNTTSGNLLTGGLISATGGVTGSQFNGSGAGLTSIPAAQVTGTLSVNTTGYAATVSTAAQPNITSVGTLSSVSVSGNVQGGNIRTAGLISATGGLTLGSGFNVTGDSSVTGNLTVSGNLNYQDVTNLVVGDPLIYLAANATGDIDDIGLVGNFDDGTYQHGGIARDHTDATWKFFANVVAEPTTVIDWANATYAPLKSGAFTSTSNITGGNILTGGLISATSTVTGSQFNGSGAGLTNLNGSNISTGTIPSARLSGTYTITVSGAATTAGTVTTAAQPNITSVGTLSSLTVTANVQGGNLRTAGLISATGGVTGSQFNGSGAGLTSIPAAQVTGTLSVNTTGSAASLTTARAINGVNFDGTAAITVEPYIEDDNTTNATRYITFTDDSTAGYKRLNESSGLTYNPSTGVLGATTFSGVSTTAKYADLAENYVADNVYPSGTVLILAGEDEVTISVDSHDPRIAGVVTTNPAHIMNSDLQAEHVVTVALIGRVPCLVKGPVNKGDRLVSSGAMPGVAEVLDMSKYQPGVIIGKALESHATSDVVSIEIVVGRL